MATLSPPLVKRLHHALDAARTIDSDRIISALQTASLVGVHGEAEVGVTSTVEHTLARAKQPSVRIDLDSAASPADVAHLTALATARLLVDPVALSLARLDPSMQPSTARRAILNLHDQLGYDLAELALSDAPSSGADELLPAALDVLARTASHEGVVLWIDHLEAPSLTPRHPVDVDALLWDLRARQQRHPLRVLLSTHTALLRRITGPRAAFHGDGEWVQLQRPDERQWAEVVIHLWDEHNTPSRRWINELLDITEQHPATTLLALARALGSEPLPRPADLIAEMTMGDPGVTARSMQHARTLHRLGGQLLERIARGDGPYVNADKSEQNTIERALGDLRRAGLLSRPRRADWTVTNPIVAIGLRQGIEQIATPHEPHPTDSPVNEAAAGGVR